MTVTVHRFPATVLGHFDAGSPEWHAARAGGVGGSEIAAVMGLSPYDSRFSLWHRKKGLISAVEESEEMYWGKVHEPGICSRFARLHPGWMVDPSPTFAAVDRPWQVVNPDRLLITPEGGFELLEAKTSRDADLWGEEGTEEIPVWYRAQCLWYMDALGARRCHVAVLIAGSEYRQYLVEYDPADALAMREAAAEFMRSLATGERPSIDGHGATYQVIRDLPEGLEDVNVEILPALRERFHAAQDGFWVAEDELTACKGLLLDAIGTGRRATVAGDRVATRTVRDGRTYQLLPARTRRTAR